MCFFFSALKNNEIDEFEIEREETILVGFNGHQTETIGRITLSVYIEGENQMTKFLVMDGPLAYNIILG